MAEQPQQTGKSWFRELAESILPALAIVLIVNVFVAQATRVEGESMVPNLLNNQRVIIEKLSYRFHEPERGDIIVLKPPHRSLLPLIKRVVALPGETIEVKDGGVYIDGEPVQEPYLVQNTPGSMLPRLVPEGHVFVMGDNRRASNDSRAFGFVVFGDIIGKAWLRYWPLDVFGMVPDPS